MAEEKPMLLKGDQALDDRGRLCFVNNWDIQGAGIKRFYQVQNHKAGFVRAWHGHLHESKYVYVPRGAALICATKIGPYNAGWAPGEVYKFTLSGTAPAILFIPVGFYNGFKTLTDDSILLFFSTSTLDESKGDDIRVSWDAFGEKIWQEDYR